MIENEGMMGTEVKRKERRGRTSLCCLTKYSEVSAAPNAFAYHKVGGEETRRKRPFHNPLPPPLER